MSDPFHEDPLIYMKTMFTDDLRFMDRMIKDKLRLQKQKLIGKFIARLNKYKQSLKNTFESTLGGTLRYKEVIIFFINPEIEKWEERRK